MVWFNTVRTFIFLLCIGGAASAQTSLQTSVIASGGGITTASGVTMCATVGQSLIGVSSRTMIASVGYWAMRKLPSSTPVDNPAERGQSFYLSSSYPNPFFSTTAFHVYLSKPGRLTVLLYDVYGRLVETLINQKADIGALPFRISADRLESGRYFIHATLDAEPRVSSIVVLK